jgi:hypothetical protein
MYWRKDLFKNDVGKTGISIFDSVLKNQLKMDQDHNVWSKLSNYYRETFQDIVIGGCAHCS